MYPQTFSDYKISTPISSLEWISHEYVAVGGSSFDSCTVLDIETGLRDIAVFSDGHFSGDRARDGVSAICKFYSSPKVFGTGFRSGKIRLFDIRSPKARSIGQTSEIITSESVRKNENVVQGLLSFADDRMIVAAHRDGMIRVWDNRFMLTAIRTLLIQDQLTVPVQGAVSVDSALRLDDRTLILQLNPSQLVCVDLFCQRTSLFNGQQGHYSSSRLFASLLNERSVVFISGSKIGLRSTCLQNHYSTFIPVDGSNIVAVSGHRLHPIIAVTTEHSPTVKVLTPS